MSLRARLQCVPGLIFFIVATTATATELPGNFPGDVPIADYMQVTSVTVVREDMMVDLHAPGKTIADVVEWFKSGLNANGWNSEGEQVTARNAILAYKKNSRRCGVSITNFVLNSSMQMDDTIKGITLQISAPSKPTPGTVDTASEIAADGVQQD